MRFTILSHAGLSVEHAGVRLLCDPWLIGSCYWRSWWNFPEPPLELVADLKPDYIYLTHLHWDHFHGVTLRKLFSRDTRILVPKVVTRRMLDDLAWLGFRNVREVAHGAPLRLGEDFVLRSYQFNFLSVDSALLVSAGGRTLLNCNDCKHFGWPLKQITNAAGKMDFVLRSHSSATPIPYCIESHRSMFPELRSQQDYIEEFSRFALHIGARYAIPFASNHCFLHRETVHFNDTAVSPPDVQRFYSRLATHAGIQSECVIMAPGSSWSEATGFELVAFDYTERLTAIDGLLRTHRERLERQYRKEEEALADFASFKAYFEAMMRSIPWMVRKWLDLRIVFRSLDARGAHRWRIDFAAGRVEEDAVRSARDPSIETPALVLNDCTTLRMFSAWTPSKRLRIHLASREQLRSITIFLTLLDLFETDVLPLRNNFTLRALGVRLRRWRELAEMATMLFKHVVLRQPISIARLYSSSLLPADQSLVNAGR